MDERKNRAKVAQALEEALRSDRGPTKVICFHDFVLVAVKLVPQDPNDEPASAVLERIRSQRQAKVQQAANLSKRKGRDYLGR
jgi:hypothetical protein